MCKFLRKLACICNFSYEIFLGEVSEIRFISSAKSSWYPVNPSDFLFFARGARTLLRGSSSSDVSSVTWLAGLDGRRKNPSLGEVTSASVLPLATSSFSSSSFFLDFLTAFLILFLFVIIIWFVRHPFTEASGCFPTCVERGVAPGRAAYRGKADTAGGRQVPRYRRRLAANDRRNNQPPRSALDCEVPRRRAPLLRVRDFL